MEQAHGTRIDTEACPHCWGLGWVQMTALDDNGEEETYFTLCRMATRSDSRSWRPPFRICR
jgi:hypothetical protein